MRTGSSERRDPERPSPRGRPVLRGRLVLAPLLFGLAAAPVLQAVGCGARSELFAPGGGGSGAGSCTRTQTSAVTASFGGGIHHIYTECMLRVEGASCPSEEEALTTLQPENCATIDEIMCGPIEEPDRCCYVALETCALT